MDEEEIRAIIRNSRGEINIWTLIKTAIKVASKDYPTNELELHRDDIIQKLYQCPTCVIKNKDMSSNNKVVVRESSRAAAKSPSTTPVDDEDEEDDDIRRKVDAAFGDDDDHDNIEVDDDDENNNVNNTNDEFTHNDDIDDVDVDDDGEDELRRILSIKEQIEDPHQSEESLVDLLQSLVDMDITFKALKETDIGRNVNRLRKHSSEDVKDLVKILVRRWKDLVDEWVKSSTPGKVQRSNNRMDGDSPQRNVAKIHQNGRHTQVPDFGYSPIPHNGSSSSDRNYSEPEPKPRVSGAAVPRRDPPPSKLYRSPSAPATAPAPNRQKEAAIDPDRLASARKRLQENYQEAQNAKKQRTIQVMDIHEIPKPRNGYVKKGGFQRH